MHFLPLYVNTELNDFGDANMTLADREDFMGNTMLVMQAGEEERNCIQTSEI
jgi:hypothetical protein